jgi:hypothetical protein
LPLENGKMMILKNREADKQQSSGNHQMKVESDGQGHNGIISPGRSRRDGDKIRQNEYPWRLARAACKLEASLCGFDDE